MVISRHSLFGGFDTFLGQLGRRRGESHSGRSRVCVVVLSRVICFSLFCSVCICNTEDHRESRKVCGVEMLETRVDDDENLGVFSNVIFEIIFAFVAQSLGVD